MTSSARTTAYLSLHAFAAGDVGTAPDWVHLLPYGPDGQIITLDQRGPYRVENPAAIIAASFQLNDRIPIDENHALDRAGPLGLPSPAYGWITEMEPRADGIWGRVEWTRAGAQLVADRAYRGISPAITHDPARRVTALLRASLVNRPNLRGMVALHNQESDMTLLERLAALLGLQSPSEDQLVTAVTALHDARTADQAALHSQLGEIGVVLGLEQGADTAAILAAARAARTGTPDQILALQSELATVTSHLGAMRDQVARDKATAFIDAEVRKGRVGVKPLRDHYVAQHMVDLQVMEQAALAALRGDRA